MYKIFLKMKRLKKRKGIDDRLTELGSAEEGYADATNVFGGYETSAQVQSLPGESGIGKRGVTRSSGKIY